MRVLLVEDSATMMYFIKGALRNLGVQHIHAAQNGHQAIEMLRLHQIDIVLTDWQMPKMSGIELLQQIRKSEFHRHLPVLMLTGESDRVHITEAIKAGIDGYLVKPICLDSLKKQMKLAYLKKKHQTSMEYKLKTRRLKKPRA